MARFRKLETNFWEDSWVEQTSPENKYFYMFLLTNPHTTQLGVYEITPKKMAYLSGYSQEAVEDIVNRFEKLGKVIYNRATNEMCIVNWAKYNLIRAGKPIIDCLTGELKNVKDASLVGIILEHCTNDSISALLVKYCIENNVTCHVTSTHRGQEEEEEKEKEKEKEETNTLSLKNSDSITGPKEPQPPSSGRPPSPSEYFAPDKCEKTAAHIIDYLENNPSYLNGMAGGDWPRAVKGHCMKLQKNQDWNALEIPKSDGQYYSWIGARIAGVKSWYTTAAEIDKKQGNGRSGKQRQKKVESGVAERARHQASRFGITLH